VAPALHAASSSLEKALVADHLKKDITDRPKKEELIEMNVLKGIPVAPALQGNAEALEKALIADQIKKDLEGRVDKDELVHANVLKGNICVNYEFLCKVFLTNCGLDIPVAPALQGPAVDLEKALIADQLKKSFNDRPPASDLYDSNILKSESFQST
jgi:hypothetical protein